MKYQIMTERLKEMESIMLLSGSHSNAEIDHQMCVMPEERSAKRAEIRKQVVAATIETMREALAVRW
jgi:hypothetical protein